MFFWLSAIVFFRRFKSFGIFFVKLSVIIFQLFDEFGSNVFVSNHQQPFFRAPCSACTIPNNVGKSIEFELRGLCERFWKAPLSPLSISFHRSGFDTDFMVNNDEETGLISYIGEIVDCFFGSSILMQERNIRRSSMTRVSTNGISLWQTTQEYQRSPILTSQQWWLVGCPHGQNICLIE